MNPPTPTPGSMWHARQSFRVTPENEFFNERLLRSRLMIRGELAVFLGSVRRPDPPPGPANSLTWIRILLTDGSTAFTIGEDWWENFEPIPHDKSDTLKKD